MSVDTSAAAFRPRRRATSSIAPAATAARSRALGTTDDPNRGPVDRAANALDGTDDPNRGPIDRAANALDGTDDPNRGPIDRAQNALDRTF